MKTLKFFALMLVISGFASYYANAQQSKTDQKADEQAIRALSMKWLDLWKKRDVAGMAALFVNDGVVYRENQEPSVGLTAIQAQFAKDFKENPKMVSNWTTDRVVIAVSGDLAIEYGSWNDNGRGSEGTDNDHGKFITVYRKVNGTWKVFSDCGISTKAVTPAK
jgi:uncharacterized protein (TIGR02246 family)